MRRILSSLVLAAVAATVSPGQASGPPRLRASIEDVQVVWQDDGDGAQRYPTLVSYTGRAEVETDTVMSVFDADTWATPQWLELSSLSPDVASDVRTAFALRGRTAPIKAQLLNDAGVNFRVAELAPFGSNLRFGQGGTDDMYFWAAAVEGSQAADGNFVEQLVVNEASEQLFPERPPAGREGALSWERMETLHAPRAAAYDPTIGRHISSELVAVVDDPFLRADGGDVSAPASAETLSLVLPADTRPFGALAVYPTGMPGVQMKVDLEFPNRATLDFRHLDVKVAATPNEFWPESRVDGATREWMWRPLLLNYGFRHDKGLPTATAFEAPLEVGMSAQALTLDGDLQRIGPVDRPGMLSLTVLGDEQQLRFEPFETPARAAVDQSATAPPLPAGYDASPELRGLMDAGAVTARFGTRAGVPSILDARGWSMNYGDLAIPAVTVDGAPVRLDTSRLRSSAVVPIAFSDGRGTGGFYGAGLAFHMVFETDNVGIETFWMFHETSFWAAGNVYVLDVWSRDGVDHAVDVDMFSRPAADSFTANDVEVPNEVLLHQEFNGDFVAENRPNVVAVDRATGSRMQYFLIVPTLLWQSQPDGVHQLTALVVDRGTFAHDLVREANLEPLAGPVALYLRARVQGPGETFVLPRIWIALTPPATTV